MAKHTVPQLCIYCKNFPCMEGDQEATVGVELKGDYPFLSEQDNLKPCDGERFETAKCLIPPAPVIEQVTNNTQAVSQLPDEPTEKFIYFFKENNTDSLQKRVDSVAQAELVVDYKLVGFTTTYDTTDQTTKIVAAIEVIQKLTDDDEDEEGNKP